MKIGNETDNSNSEKNSLIFRIGDRLQHWRQTDSLKKTSE